MLKMNHKYVSTVTIGNEGGDYGFWNWSCNGMYGPEGVLAGHQPYYFDQLSAIYNHYTVVGAKIKLTLQNLATGGESAEPAPDRCVVLASCISDSESFITNHRIVQERPSGRTHVLGPANSAAGQKTLYMSWSAKKAFGSAAISDPNLQGTSAANPSEQQWFYIGIENNPAGDFDKVCVTAEVEYIAVWQELKSIATS